MALVSFPKNVRFIDFLVGLSLFVLVLVLFPNRAAGLARQPLSAADMAWVKAHGPLKVAVPQEYPPLMLPTDPPTGEVMEYLALLKQYSGIEVVPVIRPVDQLVSMVTQGEVSGIFPAVLGTTFFQDGYVFGEPIFTGFIYAFTLKHNKDRIGANGELTGLKVGYRDKVRHLEQKISQMPGAIGVPYKSIDQLVAGLLTGEVEVILGNVDLQYTFGKMLIQVFLAHVYTEHKVEASFAIAAREARWIELLNRANRQIPLFEMNELQQRWNVGFSNTTPEATRGFRLTDDERLWLESHQVIRVAADPHYPPIESRNEQGEYHGLSIDYLRILGKMVGVRFVYDNSASWSIMVQKGYDRKVDIFSAITPTIERKGFLRFTEPYLSFPVKLFATREVGYVGELSQLCTLKVGVVSGDATQSMLAAEVPSLHLVPVVSVDAAIDALVAGQIDVFAGNLVTTSSLLSRRGETSIHMVGDTPFNIDLTIGVRSDWRPLVEVLNRALRSIPMAKRDEIQQRRLPLLVEAPKDYSLVWKIGLPLVLLVLLFWGWNALLSRRIRMRTNELRRSEERYRLLAEKSMDMISRHSLDGKYVYASPASVQIMGYTPEELIGHSVYDFVEEADRTPIRNAHNYILKEHDAFMVEFRARKKDGTHVWLETISQVISHEAFEPGGQILAITRDVTPRKEAQERAQMSEARLVHAQKMQSIGQLAGGIAHDFNNVLGGIVGFGDLARDVAADESPDVVDYIDKMLEAANRARRLVGQILTFSRTGGEEKELMELRPVVREAVALLEASIPSSISIESSLARDLLPILGDGTRIHEILMNLGTNAVRAMGNKGVLKIDLSQYTIQSPAPGLLGDIEPGRYAVISVSDTGCGMAPDVLEKAFEPFFTTRDKGEGTGLGLSVVHGIVSAHGGNIQVKTMVDQGTTIKVWLPVVESNPVSAVSVDEELSTGNERILFVDDENIIADMGRLVLGSLGYQVVACTTADDALRQIRLHLDRFDVIITDYTMPHKNGVELAEEVQRIKPGFPVILCTGYAADLDQEQLEKSGIRRLCYKPLRKKEYALAVREVLDNKEGKIPA